MNITNFNKPNSIFLKIIYILTLPITFIFIFLSRFNVAKPVKILVTVVWVFTLLFTLYSFTSNNKIKTLDKQDSNTAVTQLDKNTKLLTPTKEQSAEIQTLIKNRIQYNLLETNKVDQDSAEYIITVSAKINDVESLKKLGKQLQKEISRNPNDTVFIFTKKAMAEYKFKEKELPKSKKTEYYKSFLAVYTKSISQNINQISINIDGDPTQSKGTEVFKL